MPQTMHIPLGICIGQADKKMTALEADVLLYANLNILPILMQ